MLSELIMGNYQTLMGSEICARKADEGKGTVTVSECHNNEDEMKEAEVHRIDERWATRKTTS